MTMIRLAALALLLAPSLAMAAPPGGSSPPDLSAAQAQAAAALQQAQAAYSVASGKVAPADLTPYVKTVNGLAPVAGAVTVPVSQFVAGFTPSSPGTVANLLANQPCTTALMGQYAVVSNLYSGAAGSSTNEVMRCGSSGTMLYWRPQRTDYSATVAYTGGAMTLTPLLTPPIMYLTGTMTANGTITPSAVGAWPGEQFQIVQTGALGLFSLQVGGLLGSVLNLITGGTRTLTYSCNASNVCGWQGN